VRDAQCGFKAVRTDVAQRLLPAVVDDAWFFDTELLLLAQHNGLRVHEVPVDWIDDDDSRVDVTRTALDDLAGVIRMVRTFWGGRGRVDLGDAARPELEDDFGRRMVLFGLIGAVSTCISLLIFLALHGTLDPVAANAIAMTATFVANTWANARFTAQASPRWLPAVSVFAGSLAISSFALVLVDAAGGALVAQLVVLLATWSVAAGGRLALVSSWARNR
jgi:putative flippase GtrA